MKLPMEVQGLLTGFSWRQVTIGKSNAKTYRLEQNGYPSYFLKVAPAAHIAPLQSSISPLLEEHRVLTWLKGKLPVPAVAYYTEEGGQAYLLTTALSGRDAASLKGALPPTELVSLLGKGLRTIHNLTIAGCGLDRSLDWAMAAAQENTALGLVDESDFDPERLGRSAQEVLKEVMATRPVHEDLVFTHGDYCLPNVIIDVAAVSGYVDWGRGGIGDPYRDIALAVRSIRYNLGPGLEEAFFAAYGLAHPNWRKIAFYQLLDEFF